MILVVIFNTETKTNYVYLFLFLPTAAQGIHLMDESELDIGLD